MATIVADVAVNSYQWRGRTVERYWARITDMRDPQGLLASCPHDHREIHRAEQCAAKLLRAVEAVRSRVADDPESLQVAWAIACTERM